MFRFRAYCVSRYAGLRCCYALRCRESAADVVAGEAKMRNATSVTEYHFAARRQLNMLSIGRE